MDLWRDNLVLSLGPSTYLALVGKKFGGTVMPRIAMATFASLSTLLAAPAASSTNTEEASAPPLMECAFFAGESQLLDGQCRVVNLPNGHILINEEARPGFIFIVRPNRKRDEVLWNGSDRRQKTLSRLGSAYGIENCWMSVPKSEIHFSLCLTPLRVYQGKK